MVISKEVVVEVTPEGGERRNLLGIQGKSIQGRGTAGAKVLRWEPA